VGAVAAATPCNGHTRYLGHRDIHTLLPSVGSTLRSNFQPAQCTRLERLNLRLARPAARSETASAQLSTCCSRPLFFFPARVGGCRLPSWQRGLGGHTWLHVQCSGGCCFLGWHYAGTHGRLVRDRPLRNSISGGAQAGGSIVVTADPKQSFSSRLVLPDPASLKREDVLCPCFFAICRSVDAAASAGGEDVTAGPNGKPEAQSLALMTNGVTSL
jgi:hypothetical protein